MTGTLTNTPIPASGSAFQIQVPEPGDGATPVDYFAVLASGTFTANSGSAVTVADAGVTAQSIIVFTLKTVGGTVAAPFVATITPGTGFAANSGGSDTSVYNWLRIG